MAIIEIDVGTLRRSKFGSVTSGIWLQVGNECFPEYGWSDFPVVILGWWITRLLELVSGQQTSVDCLFMDGPLAFRLIEVEPHLLEIRIGRQGEQLRLLGRVSADEFGASLRLAAKRIIQACESQGWTSRDLDALREEEGRLLVHLGN